MAEIQREKERAELDAALERVKSRAGVASPRDTKAVAGEDELKEIARLRKVEGLKEIQDGADSKIARSKSNDRAQDEANPFIRKLQEEKDARHGVLTDSDAAAKKEQQRREDEERDRKEHERLRKEKEQADEREAAAKREQLRLEAERAENERRQQAEAEKQAAEEAAKEKEKAEQEAERTRKEEAEREEEAKKELARREEERQAKEVQEAKEKAAKEREAKEALEKLEAAKSATAATVTVSASATGEQPEEEEGLSTASFIQTVAQVCDIQRYAETLYPYDHPDKSDPNFFSFQAGQYFGIILDREDLQGWRLVINADNQKGFVPGNFLKILSEAESAVIAQKIKGNDNGASKPASLAPHNRHDELLKALDDQGHPSLDLVESGKESSLPKDIQASLEKELQALQAIGQSVAEAKKNGQLTDQQKSALDKLIEDKEKRFKTAVKTASETKPSSRSEGLRKKHSAQNINKKESEPDLSTATNPVSPRSREHKDKSDKHSKSSRDNNAEQSGGPASNMAEAMYSYTHPDPNSREFFSFNAGAKFTVIQCSPELKGWTIVLDAEGRKGFVPGNYLNMTNVVVEEGLKKKPSSGNITSARKGYERKNTNNNLKHKAGKSSGKSSDKKAKESSKK